MTKKQRIEYKQANQRRKRFILLHGYQRWVGGVIQDGAHTIHHRRVIRVPAVISG